MRQQVRPESGRKRLKMVPRICSDERRRQKPEQRTTVLSYRMRIMKKTDATKSTDAGSTADGKVDINTAGKDELMTLSGIGEAKADAIIRYRDEHGKFQKIEDLMEVEGIKDGVFQKVKDQIKI